MTDQELHLMETLLIDKPKLLTKGKTFVTEHDCASVGMHIRHTHSMFNQFSTIVMKNLLDETTGLPHILLEHQDKDVQISWKAISTIIASGMWAVFPTTLVSFGRLLYARYQARVPDQADEAWKTFLSELPVKMADVLKIWPSVADVTNFLQLRVKYMQCMIDIVVEHLKHMAESHKSTDLEAPTKRVAAYLEKAAKFTSACFVEVSSVDCQQDAEEEWASFWRKAIEKGYSVMSLHCTVKSDPEWQKRLIFKKTTELRGAKVADLKEKALEFPELLPAAGIESMNKDALAEFLAERAVAREKDCAVEASSLTYLLRFRVR